MLEKCYWMQNQMLNLTNTIITKKAHQILRTASILVVPYDLSKFKNNHIKVPMAHRSEYMDYGDSNGWIELNYNFRLNNIDNIYYAIKDGSVVGHIGLDSHGFIRAVYVDPDNRRRGISEKLHLDIFKANHRVISEDVDVMGLGESNLWKKLLKQMPNKIKSIKDGSFVYQF